MRNVAYLRVSKIEQDLRKDRSQILELANFKNLVPVEFIEEKISGRVSWKKRALGDIMEALGEGDNLIVTELSRLGRSMLECMEVISVATRKKIHIYSVKNSWVLNGSIESKIFAMVFSMAAEIERDLISYRTTEALRAKRARGEKLGRPRGPGKSKLDKYREEIFDMLKNGSTKVFIARRFGTTTSNLHNWIKKKYTKTN